jgi:hypothetical protein
MLIILSGTESINKNFLAKKIFCEFNPPFPLTGGYTVKFDTNFESSENSKSFVAHPYEIFDSNGNTVYSKYTGNNSVMYGEGGKISTEGVAIFKEAEELYDRLFLDLQETNGYNVIFTDLEYDLGFDTTCYDWDTKSQQHSFPHNYNDVLNKYKNKNYPVQVITGSFSKAFIDLIKKDIGDDNVKVYNIIRHPTVVTCLDEKSSIYYEKNPKMNPNLNRAMTVKSVMNTYILSTYDEFTTIKFEDMTTTGYFIVEGKKIELPEGYFDFNGFISVWEKENVDWAHIDSSAIEPALYIYANTKAALEKEYNTTFPQVAESLLAHFEYPEITLDQIVAPKE